MGWGRRGRPVPGGSPRLPLGVLAAAALSALLWAALPVGAMTAGPTPLADTQGPVITNVRVPFPVAPDSVLIRATATDDQSIVVAAEFSVDYVSNGSRTPFKMLPEAPPWDSSVEDVNWSGSYDFFTQGLAPGTHSLFLHARDSAGNWGPYANVPFVISDPTTTGPQTLTVDVAPANVTEGGLTTINATLIDWFHKPIVRAEFFLDAPGPYTSGISMTGPWGVPSMQVTWSGVLPTAFGEHLVFVHGENGDGTWGTPVVGRFIARAPAFTLLLLPDRDTAGPGETVTYRLPFENRGNADATSASLPVSLPGMRAYASDTIGNTTAIGGGLAASTAHTAEYVFATIPPGSYEFTISASVAPTATDGLLLSPTATLDFTNEHAWDFPAIAATAQGTVVAPELSMSVDAPPIANAGESTVVTIQLDNSGVRDIPVVTVALPQSAWTHVRTDNAAILNGRAVGVGTWVFADMPPGFHAFLVTEDISTDAPDGATIAWAAEAGYTSRVGAWTTITASGSAAVSRPMFFAPTVDFSPEVVEGATATLTVRFANEGSVAARSARLQVALPVGLSWVGGNPPSSVTGRQYAWDFSYLPPGGYSVEILVAGSAAGRADIQTELTYTSANGAALGDVSTSATLVVRPAPIPPATVYATASLAASASGLAVFVATERGKTAFLFLFLPLYTRLRHEKVLDHETRGMIRGYIVANPGDHYNAIKEALELPNGTLAYHIQVLQKEMIVKSVKDGKFRRFYPYEMRVPETGQPTKSQRVILDLIRVNPGITPRDAAALLGLTSSTVSYHLERLEDLARIEYRREGISKKLYVKGGDPAA
ncbi:MAG: winged helix-turn-helix transcriptional regulator [Methanobacteriota archaeon]|nr:MAG: winged helix-turn-helix transcriptional regulator [Euryarchaeota archaeon]